MHPTQETPKYVNQILMDIKGETDRNTVIVRDFNTALTSMDRSSRQKVNKDTAVLNDTLDQMDFIDIFRAFHPKAADYTYFSSAHGTFSKIDHMLGHKTSLNKFKRLKSYQASSLTIYGIKLQINNKRKTEKHRKTQRLNSMLLNNKYVNSVIKQEIPR